MDTITNVPGEGKEGSRVGVAREQQVLGDITNTYNRKGVPLVPGKFLIANDTIRKRECIRGGIEDRSTKKRVLGELENTSKEKCAVGICRNVVACRNDLPLAKRPDDGCSKHPLSPKAQKICESAILECHPEPAESNLNLDLANCSGRNGRFSDLLDDRHFQVSSSHLHGPGDAGRRDSCTSSVSLPLWLERVRAPLPVAGKTNQVSSQKSRGGMSNIIQTDLVTVRKCNQWCSQKSGDGISNILLNDAVAAYKCKSELDKSPIRRNASSELVNLTEHVSQGTSSLPTERPNGNPEYVKSGTTELLGPNGRNIEGRDNAEIFLEHSTNVEEDMVADKACSCSLCLKAACLWTELLYQDIRGRLSEINRSRRDASFLAGRRYGHDFVSSTGRNKRKITGLESELTQHWRNLFLHTENILMCESAQLQSSLLKLKKLRENCKRDVDSNSRVPSGEA